MTLFFLGVTVGGAFIGVLMVLDHALYKHKAEKRFWDGYAQGVREERQRQAEEARSIVSRMADGPLLFGRPFDELREETEAERIRRIATTDYPRWKPE